MILVDTSVWVDILKDKKGIITHKFKKVVQSETIVFSRFIQMELLQGARNKFEWEHLNNYLESQYYLEARQSTWINAAKIYYDLRKKGITIRSTIDACIAQTAIKNKTLLLHNDKDFIEISKYGR